MGQHVIVMGASMGGVQALGDVLSVLPATFAAPVLVVQHTRAPSSLAIVLGNRSNLPVVTASDGMLIEPGHVYLAPPNRHMLVNAGELRLGDGPTENGFRPSIDVLFRSAALAYGPMAVGVILTGYLYDGAAGLLAVKDCGGVAIVQDPKEAAAPDMPLAAIHATGPAVCRLAAIATKLIEISADDPSGTRTAALTLELENRLAADPQARESLAALLRGGRKTSLVCQICSGWLYELGEQRMRRYRCERGHAISEAALAHGTLGYVA